jgi:hypothetical protein
MCAKDAEGGGLKAHIYAFNINININMTKTVMYLSLWLKKQGSWSGEPLHEQN